MYRRVLIPMALVIGVSAVLWLVGAEAGFLQRAAFARLQGGSVRWMLPVLPTSEWLAFLVVFFAVRLCALGGGSRRECIAVGTSVLAFAFAGGLIMLKSVGLASLLTVFGDPTPVRTGFSDLGSALMVRSYASQLLGLAGTCLGATWLWFFVSRHGTEVGTGTPA